jgi:integrase
MSRQPREIPTLQLHENGNYYAHWYDAAANRTKRKTLETRDPAEASKRFGQFLIGGPPDARGHAGLTVRQALGDYRREHVEAIDDKGRPRVTDVERQLTIISHLTNYFGEDGMLSIGPVESRGYVAARRKGEIGGGKTRGPRAGSDSTIRRELNCLVAAFNHAIKWGRLPADTRARIELPAEAPVEEIKWLTKEQVSRAIAAASGDLKDFMVLAYYTAARRASIERLTRSQVDLQHGRINLAQDGARVTKKRKPIVPIYAEIRPTVERLMNRGQERLLGSANFYRPFIRLMEGMGITAHPHMLRHSRATHLLQDGEDIYMVARLLGDTVATVDRVYAHSTPEFLMTKKRAAI